ncbi:MAG: glycosyltransferase [Desulfobacterales bacterium]|nr:glycosyltransferase [Desulfobacterales bacterium]
MNQSNEKRQKFSRPQLYTEQSHFELLDILEQFFFLIDSGRLFETTDPVYYQKLRKRILNAFAQLLVWQRPLLEGTRGFYWPYEALEKRLDFFKDIVSKSKHSFVSKQAQLFLALLPFPGQWDQLRKAQSDLINYSEIRKFFKIENRKIQNKLSEKIQKQFKLRHFCQILKKPKMPYEKGVLRIFSLPYIFFNYKLLKDLSRYYFFYIEPPMGVIFRHTWLRVFSTSEDPCLFGVGGKEDEMFLKGQQGIITTRLAHGDFLSNDAPIDVGKEKLFDMVFNATFDDMPRKRHMLMLTLLQHPLLGHCRALFLGRGTETNVKIFKEKIQQAGLAKRVRVLANLRREDVPKYLAQSKIGVHLSLYENACRSIYEYFRSDLPCVISSSMAGMNLEIFNSQTGMTAIEKDLPKAISKVLCNRNQYTPRSWFLANSGSLNSSRKLNDQIRSIFKSQGYEWTEDIVPLTSSGASRYINIDQYEAFRLEFEELLKIFHQNVQLPINLTVD